MGKSRKQTYKGSGKKEKKTCFDKNQLSQNYRKAYSVSTTGLKMKIFAERPKSDLQTYVNSISNSYKCERSATEEPDWFHIQISNGFYYEKELILKKLTLALGLETVLWPLMWRSTFFETSFYLDDFEIAQKLLNLHERIQMPDGNRLSIQVGLKRMTVLIPPEIEEAIKETLRERYNSVTRSADLTNFHADPNLNECLCPISTSIVIGFEIIKDVETINLQNNKIKSLSFFERLLMIIPDLVIRSIDLSFNNIDCLSLLTPLLDFPLEELNLEGNPLIDSFRNIDECNKQLKKMFPKLLMVNRIC